MKCIRKDKLYKEIDQILSHCEIILQGLGTDLESNTDFCETELLDDGTLTIKVDDAVKVGRVLVQDDNNCGGLYYPDEEKQGEWIKTERQNIWGMTVGCYDCSKCGIAAINHDLIMDTEGLDFCPNCGTDMRG